mmetsp:Transcript_22946/g.32894  ORF Transcript_22946/g.32894 Transcript_22946/m.32894 type:complete len:313 (-) Transcript_22946:219-1157(-)
MSFRTFYLAIVLLLCADCTSRENDDLVQRKRRHVDIPLLVASVSNETQFFTTSTTRLFDKYLIIVLENKNYSSVIQDPYFQELAGKGAAFTNFFGQTHPSYPNYLAMIGGSIFGVTSNQQQNLTNSTIADLLEAKHLTWKNYAEEYPGNCYLKSSYASGKYTRKHVPFLSFLPIQQNSTRCGHVVSADQFQEDWKNGQLPNYSFYTPSNENNAHDTNVTFASEWLQSFLEPLLNDTKGMKGLMIEITFDEAYPTSGPNHIYTILIGEMLKPGLTIATRYDHFDMLRTVERNFNLGTLGREDSTAAVIRELWQ